MTAQLSRERREIIKQTANHIISREDTSEHSENLKAVAELALLALAGMESEPVAVPDDFIIPELATLTNINKLCPLDVNLSQTDFATGWNDCRKYALNNGELPPIIKGVHAGAQGWNACRAAMLKAGPVTAVTVPDGWKLVPLIAFPSQWAAGQKAFNSAGINKVDAVYKAMVEAAPTAPEQEV